MNKLKKKVSAFTLTELLVAVVIVGALIGLAVGVIHKARQKAAEARAPVDIHDMKIALEQYNTDHGAYPPSGNKNLVLAAEPYTEIDPKNIKDGKLIDPWGNPYVYENPGKVHPGGYDLYTQGGPGGNISIPITAIPRTTSTGGTSTSTGTPPTNSGGVGGGGILYTFSNPDVLIATPNSGYVHLAWPPMASGSKEPIGFNIYRSTSADGSYDKINGQPVAGIEYIDKVPSNDTSYSYKLQAVFADGWSVLSNAVSAMPTSDNLYSLKIGQAFDVLNSSGSGASIAGDIAKYNVPMLFGYIDPGLNYAAWFSPELVAIMISVAEKDYSAEAAAALLAHEGTHAQWYFDKTLGTPIPTGVSRSDNSIDQEYSAFLNQTAVWSEMKGSQTNDNLDSWAVSVGLGEADAKKDIRTSYPELSEY